MQARRYVVTLLAILELARLKAVRVLQSPTDDTLFITRVSEEAIEKARHITITSAVEVGADAAAADDDGEEAAFAPPAESAGELNEVFESLPTTFSTKPETTEITFLFAALGGLLALAALGLALWWQPLV